MARCYATVFEFDRAPLGNGKEIACRGFEVVVVVGVWVAAVVGVVVGALLVGVAVEPEGSGLVLGCR